MFTCLKPTSSVLFDGNIPTLTGLDGNTWASQLLTIRLDIYSPTMLTFSFNGTPNYAGVRRVEIALFNCEQWGISVQSIKLQARGNFVGATNPIVTSCDSLVRMCIPNLRTTERELVLTFIPTQTYSLVHIAEVTFYGNSPTCPPDAIFNTATTTDTTTAGMCVHNI